MNLQRAIEEDRSKPVTPAFERFLTTLEKHGSRVIRRDDRHATAQCPAHDDQEPSLSVTGDCLKVLIYCHAGCSQIEVLQALGLSWRDMEDANRADPMPKVNQPNSEDNGSSWLSVDLAAMLDGAYEPLRPTIGNRADGLPVLYAGKRHAVVGESEAGKTWLALVLAAQEFERGHAVVFIDFEDDGLSIAGRLLTIGVSPTTISDRFHYLHPDEPLGENGGKALDELIATSRPTLVVIDGVTEAMSLHGLKVNDNDDAAKFDHLLPKRISRQGPAVITIDHVTKSKDSRGRYALGAVHKLNGVDVQFLLDADDQFAPGRVGRSHIKIGKDKPGGLKASSSLRRGTFLFGDLVIDARQEPATFAIEPPKAVSDWRPTHLMAQICELLANEPDGLSQRAITDRVSGKTQAVRQALEFLISDGYVERTPGKRGSFVHRLVLPYYAEASAA